MIIQWFPGHMTKTQKLIKENLQYVDVFLELVDARAPFSSRNPLLNELIINKPRVIILTKMDLADPSVTARWKETFENDANTRVILVSAKERKNISSIPQVCLELIKSLKANPPKSIRAMIVGIPNVGKSTLINALTNAHKASVAPKPGHTRGLQNIRLNPQFELIDSPGILWHKFEDMAVGQRLAMLGAIKDDVYDFHALCLMTIEFLTANYPKALVERYKLSGTKTFPDDIIEEIAQKRGYILSGGVLDLDRAFTAVMNDLRLGTLGRISLEKP